MAKLGNNSVSFNAIRMTRNFPFPDLTESLCQHYGDFHLRPDVHMKFDTLGVTSHYEDFYGDDVIDDNDNDDGDGDGDIGPSSSSAKSGRSNGRRNGRRRRS